MIRSFFKPPSHRSFSYEPRFYDPEKIEREQRRKAIEQEILLEKGAPIENTYKEHYQELSHLRGAFTSARSSQKNKKLSISFHQSVNRLILIGTLGLGLYAYIYTENKEMEIISLMMVGFAWFGWRVYKNKA